MTAAIQEQENGRRAVPWQERPDVVRAEHVALRYAFPTYFAYTSWLNHMREGLFEVELKQLCVEETERIYEQFKEWREGASIFGPSLGARAEAATQDTAIFSLVKEEDLPTDLENWNKERLEKTIEGWRRLFDFNIWFPIDQDPFFAILPKAYHDLPHQIVLGPDPLDVLQRQFDRVYVLHPHKNTPEMLTAYYDHLAPIYESADFLDLYFKESLVEMLCYRAEIDLRKAKRVLEIGIGTGFSRVIIPPEKLYGVDLSPKMCQEARKHGIEVRLANAEEGLPFPDDYFDGVIIPFSAHCFKTARPFEEAKRVLKEGARMSLNLYKPKMLYPGIDWKKEYATMLTNAGFSDIRFCVFCSRTPADQVFETDIISAKA